MNLREVNLLLERHRRRWWWPRLCRCGARYPCRCRELGEAELLVHAARQADVARRHAARLADGDTVLVAGYRRYADLLPPSGRLVAEARLVRPYTRRQP